MLRLISTPDLWIYDFKITTRLKKLKGTFLRFLNNNLQVVCKIKATIIGRIYNISNLIFQNCDLVQFFITTTN